MHFSGAGDEMTSRAQHVLTTQAAAPMESPNAASCDAVHPKHLKASIGVCGVCGDKAFFHNFNALTCQACKAFFRRNAKKRKVSFPIPFDS